MEAYMAFFSSAIDTLQTLVIALGAGLGVWAWLICWRATARITRAPMLMVNKEAQQKQDKDSSPAAIPKQGEIENQIERI